MKKVTKKLTKTKKVSKVPKKVSKNGKINYLYGGIPLLLLFLLINGKNKPKPLPDIKFSPINYNNSKYWNNPKRYEENYILSKK